MPYAAHVTKVDEGLESKRGMKQISLKLKVSTADEHVSGFLCKLEP